ncbi:hypothetical protein [Curvivirga sp.]|uniref:hypothetical protein n=1 Tax=Curvivirga sp. TaxID=2856848 RepID=UPI003B59C3C8
MPKTIRLFCLFGLMVIAIGVAITVLSFTDVISPLNHPRRFLLTHVALFILILGIKRRGSSFLSLIYTLLSVLIIFPPIFRLMDLSGNIPLKEVLRLLQMILGSAALYCLYAQDSRNWVLKKSRFREVLLSLLTYPSWIKNAIYKNKNANEYGWLMHPGEASALSQQSGYFVSEQNEIMFWPGKQEPGYYISEEDVGHIVLSEERKTGWKMGLILFLSLMLMIFGLFQYALKIHPILESYSGFQNVFSSKMLMVAGIFSLLCLYFICMMFVLRGIVQNRWINKTRDYLKTNRKIHSPRPKYKKVKTSDIWDGYVSFKILAWLFIPLLVIAISLTVGLKIGDLIIILIVSSFLLLVPIYAIWQEIIGINMMEENLYRPLNAESQSSIDAAETENKDENHLKLLFWRGVFGIEWLLTGRQLVFITGPIFLSVLILYPKINEETISVNELPAWYQTVVFGSQETGYAPSHITKWDQEVIIYLDPQIPEKLLHGLMAELSDWGKKASLDLTVIEDDEDHANIHIYNVADYLLNSQGEQMMWTFESQQSNGLLEDVKIFVSTKKMRENIDDSKTQDKLYEGLAINLSSKALGLWGDYIANPQKFSSSSFDRYALYDLLISIHYDDRIKAGMTVNEVMPFVEKIAMEKE